MDRAKQLHGPPLCLRHSVQPAWISSVSAGVKKGSNNISCGTIPIETFALRGCLSMSKPQIDAVPPSCSRAREDVDDRRLAGAVRPEQPNICPRGTSMLIPSSARLPP
jgi:hypothetical protein